MDSNQKLEYIVRLKRSTEDVLNSALKKAKSKREVEEGKIFPNILELRDTNEKIDMMFTELARRSGLVFDNLNELKED